MHKIELSLYVIFLYGLFLILAGLFVYHLRTIGGFLKKLSGKNMGLLTLVFACALSLRLSSPHQILCDEYIYKNVAQNMHNHRQFGGTIQGSKDQPEKIGFYNRPGGHPLLISFSYVFFGASDKSAFLLNSLLGATTAALLFLFVYVALRNIIIAFCAGFLTGILPLHVLHSASLSSEISSLFFIALSLFVFSLFLETGKTSLLYWLSASVIFSAYIRPENALFFIPLAGFCLFLAQRGRLSRTAFWNLTYFLAALILPLLIQILKMKTMETAVAQEAFWTPGLLARHARDNLLYLLNDAYHPFLYTVFALCGCYSLYRMNRRLLWMFLAWLGVAFVAYSSYYAGAFSQMHRYFFMCIIPLTVLAACGIDRTLQLLGKKLKPPALAVILIALSWNALAVKERLEGALLDSAREREYAFIKNQAKNLPNDEYILTVEPYFVASGLNKKALSAGLRPSVEPQKLLLLKMITWREDDFSQVEEQLKKDYDFKTVAQGEFDPNSRTFIAELTKKQTHDAQGRPSSSPGAL